LVEDGTPRSTAEGSPAETLSYSSSAQPLPGLVWVEVCYGRYDLYRAVSQVQFFQRQRLLSVSWPEPPALGRPCCACAHKRAASGARRTGTCYSYRIRVGAAICDLHNPASSRSNSSR